MEGIVSAVGLALTAAILALVIQKDAPGIAFLMTLAAGLAILTFAMHNVSNVLTELSGALRVVGIERGLYLPVVKAVGIAAVVRVAGSLCRDAGQTSLAAKLELLGAVAAMAVTLPLFTRILSMVSSMIA